MSRRKVGKAADPHALALEHKGQRLVFKCTYSTLLQLEAAEDWKALLADAISFTRPSALIEITAAFTGLTPAQVADLSPPVAETQRCITAAWALCMEGPEGLRRYQEAVAREAAAEAGKPKQKSSSAASFWTTLAGRFKRAFLKGPSGG
jgi:hypothetical protein